MAGYPSIYLAVYLSTSLAIYMCRCGCSSCLTRWRTPFSSCWSAVWRWEGAATNPLTHTSIPHRQVHCTCNGGWLYKLLRGGETVDDSHGNASSSSWFFVTVLGACVLFAGSLCGGAGAVHGEVWGGNCGRQTERAAYWTGGTIGCLHKYQHTGVLCMYLIIAHWIKIKRKMPAR